MQDLPNWKCQVSLLCPLPGVGHVHQSPALSFYGGKPPNPRPRCARGTARSTFQQVQSYHQLSPPSRITTLTYHHSHVSSLSQLFGSGASSAAGPGVWGLAPMKRKTVFYCFQYIRPSWATHLPHNPGAHICHSPSGYALWLLQEVTALLQK